jgi:hypothetical protein
MALGIAAGTVARRTLPAIAVTLGGFITLRLLIADFVRPPYMAAVTTYYNVTAYNVGSFTPPGKAWLPNEGAVSKAGVVVPRGWGTLGDGARPRRCRLIVRPVRGPGADIGRDFSSSTVTPRPPGSVDHVRHDQNALRAISAGRDESPRTWAEGHVFGSGRGL